ncbi:protein DpdE [Paraburkholderia tropica]|uniref:protein DpdE n=1 Tax=Paraburkholderia tropica TaxID=92647 RepID=UPI002AB748FA|nr:protein DpdE [Paraburkholderia tropica]
MFVKCTLYPGDGIAKLLQQGNGDCVIEYFDEPFAERVVRTVPAATVSRSRLHRQTRVYFFDQVKKCWRIARVFEVDGSTLQLKLPNGLLKVRDVADVFVRWDRPISDPSTYLANFVTESPSYVSGRGPFMRQTMALRGGFQGLSAYASSRIELLQHQYEVVRRVLSDPCQRYLLADEVGLGKTIEAGIVLRQYVLDYPTSHVAVVIVPPPLVQQWREELRNTFHLFDFLDESIFVVGFDNRKAMAALLPKAGMLVVDEAHQVTAGYGSDDPGKSDLFKEIALAAISTRRLLLLSATPALGNERTFLAMLHLLDPRLYRLEDETLFREKIQHRVQLSELVATLVPDNVFLLGNSIKQLRELFPRDNLMAKLCDELQAIVDVLPDEDDPDLDSAIRTLRAHVSETYRLSRRVLRNRRAALSFLTPNRRGVKVLKYATGARVDIERALEDWRIGAITEGVNRDGSVASFQPIFLSFLDAFFSDTSVLRDLVSARLHEIDGASNDTLRREVPSFLGESECLRRLLSAIAGPVEGSVEICRLVSSLVGQRGQKLVLFTSSESRADQLYTELAKHMRTQVVRHRVRSRNVDMSEWDDFDETLETEWKRFTTDAACSVIVCDGAAEDGLNLQGGNKIVLHADLPFSPNRIEQRIGRVDRFGSGGAVLSYVGYSEESQWDRAWFSCLNNGFEVFDRSVASLQYLIDDRMAVVRAKLLLDGADALCDLEASLVEDMAIQREIDRLDKMDALDSIDQGDSEDFELLEEADGEWARIREDVDEWAVKTLQFSQIKSGASDLEQVIRYQYSSDESSVRTLLPLTRFLEYPGFIEAIDTEQPGARQQTPRTFAYAFRRPTALAHNAHVLRYGSAFWRGLEQFSLLDERGRSSAMWRFVPEWSGIDVANVFIRFDFIVEGDVAEAFALSKGVGHGEGSYFALRRRADAAFEPMVVTVWLNSEYEEVTDQTVLERLNAPYIKEPHLGKGQDFNLNPERWDVLRKLAISSVDDWSVHVRHSRSVAEQVLREREGIRAKIREAGNVSEIRHRLFDVQRQARLAFMELDGLDDAREAVRFEAQLDRALSAGIASPSIRIDAVQAVFVSNRTLAELEAAAI